jgi:UDP-N-acetylglucosamine 2-epimerase (non-hydrolysing)
VVFPAHPRTRERLERFGLLARLTDHPAVRLCEPLPYRENLSLMADAAVALTDSGGIQEESSYLRVPCLTLRANTERPVTVTHGTNTLVGDDLDRAWQLLREVMKGHGPQGGPIEGWDGHAAERVIDALTERWATR